MASVTGAAALHATATVTSGGRQNVTAAANLTAQADLIPYRTTGTFSFPVTPGLGPFNGVRGVCVGWGTAPWGSNFYWYRHDASAPQVMVEEIRIHRGRTYTTDQMNGGTCEVDFLDQKGALDLTNGTAGNYPFHPNCPFAIGMKNQSDGSWYKIFSGHLKSMPEKLDMSENWITGTMKAADGLELLANMEVPAGYDFLAATDGSKVANSLGDTTLAAQTVQARLFALLAYANVPSNRTNLKVGNVNVQQSVEPAGTAILECIQACVDAELPTVSNFWMDRTGLFRFGGRFVRLKPSLYPEFVSVWHLGDKAYCDTHTISVNIAELEWDQDVAKIINDAVLTPQGVLDADIGTLEVAASGSINSYGLRNYSGAELLTAGGNNPPDNNSNSYQEVKSFNQFLVDNFKNPFPRVNQITIRNPIHGANNFAEHWNFLTHVDIGDVVHIKTTHPGGGGFADARFFVEGVDYSIRALQNDEWLVELVLDCSPADWWSTWPAAWGGTGG